MPRKQKARPGSERWTAKLDPTELQDALGDALAWKRTL